MANNTEQRLRILTKSEREELYSIPQFDLLKRQKNFTLSEDELEALNNLKLFNSQIYFILQLGYLRERPLIYDIIFYERKDDIQFILEKYFPGKKFPRGAVSKRNQYNLINKALQFTHRSRADDIFYQKLDTYLDDIATICVEPRYLFDECLNFYDLHKKVFESYRTFCDKISHVLSNERKRLESLLNKKLSLATKSFFRQLLVVENSLSDLTKLRKSPKNLKGIDVKRELESHQKIQAIYPEIKAIVQILNISAKNLAYYCTLINYYNVAKLRRFTELRVFLYLTCFIYFRYQQINDNLIAIFGYQVRKHKDSSMLHGQKKMLELSNNLWDKIKLTLPFLSVFIDDDIENTQPIGELRASRFKSLSRSELTTIYKKIEMADADKKEYGWQYFDEHQRLISIQIRPLFLAMDIEMRDLDSVFYNQITTTKQELSSNMKVLKTIDKRIFTHDAKKYLVKDGEVNTKRFEYFLYHRVNQGIIKGDIYISESEKYRQLEDHLIEKNLWKKDKQIFLKKAGLPKLELPIESLLDDIEHQLKQRITTVCENITGGSNSFVVLTDRKNQLKWSIPVQKDENSINNPFFSYVPQANIADLMIYVDQVCHFLSVFKHTSTLHPISESAKDDLIACVLADGTGYGIEHMANISDRSFARLRLVESSYVQLENIQESNDILVDEISKLSIFKYYAIDNDRLYASIDGQKFETRINSFKSRYSAKYFKEKGVSALTLSCNHVALKTKVIGANEYEGHFAFDLLYNNTSDIEPDVLSTDTHGTNQVNFAILDLFGYQFAPRYAKLKKVFSELFDVDNNNGNQSFIRLKKLINRKLIIEEWDEIQRIICSLSRKSITQSTLVQKLSTFSPTNRTLVALREYDKIIKANYLLHYIDDHSLRKYVQKTLNRGEAYHQLRRKIASVNGDKFRGGNDFQIENWNECARLIANCVIYFNASILSSLLSKFKNDDKIRNIITRLSPVAWKNINFNGIYAFSTYEIITMEKLLAKISEENTDFISL